MSPAHRYCRTSLRLQILKTQTAACRTKAAQHMTRRGLTCSAKGNYQHERIHNWKSNPLESSLIQLTWQKTMPDWPELGDQNYVASEHAGKSHHLLRGTPDT
eukprot:gnl/MRDRNA2_/MRDRNA2_85134_c0_seq1.p1 gnl/MRDRNA2_/MRDRNA2_85134_c0~~gnl/MRDRNA2_/MRDRNA2_85134_c0_seq1.p1  ORF type:complete len:102 (+),score=11.57 gnl/MRDRNA2_/MRDRNA2_85134_c0_seq1:482-787(+)